MKITKYTWQGFSYICVFGAFAFGLVCAGNTPIWGSLFIFCCIICGIALYIKQSDRKERYIYHNQNKLMPIMNDKPLHIKLLEQFANNDLGKRVNFAPFIVVSFNRPKMHDYKDWYIAHTEVYNFLNDLKFRKFIEVEQDSAVTFLFEKKEDDIKVKKWYNDVEMYGFVTSAGLDYLDNYNLVQSNKGVNEASLLNYKIQLWGTAITILIAGLAAFYSIQSYLKPEPKMIELNKNVRLLSAGLDSIKSQINHLQSQKTLPVEKSRKH